LVKDRGGVYKRGDRRKIRRDKRVDGGEEKKSEDNNGRGF